MTPVDSNLELNDSATILTIQIQVFDTEQPESDKAVLTPQTSMSNLCLSSSCRLNGQESCANLDVNKLNHHGESAHKYIPHLLQERNNHESDVPPPVIRDTLTISEFPKGSISTAWVNMVKEGLSEWIRVPVIIARGKDDGPVVGITAVVHGNELNGVPCIHKVISDIDVNNLKGTVVAVPCVNVPGYLRFTREFSDGKDLNRSFPGKESGMSSQIFNHHFFEKIITKLDYLIDLHTASFGRINSYYVRSDMNDPISSIMAKLQQPQIILHNSGQDGAHHG